MDAVDEVRLRCISRWPLVCGPRGITTIHGIEVPQLTRALLDSFQNFAVSKEGAKEREPPPPPTRLGITSCNSHRIYSHSAYTRFISKLLFFPSLARLESLAAMYCADRPSEPSSSSDMSLALCPRCNVVIVLL